MFLSTAGPLGGGGSGGCGGSTGSNAAIVGVFGVDPDAVSVLNGSKVERRRGGTGGFFLEGIVSMLSPVLQNS